MTDAFRILHLRRNLNSSEFALRSCAPLLTGTDYVVLRDYAGSGSVYVTPDSGGECGVAYESYFPMPAVSKHKPWYSIEQGSVHFIVMSTEHEWSEKSEQVYNQTAPFPFLFQTWKSVYYFSENFLV